MRDRLWDTTWRISVAAFAAALVAAVVFWVLDRPLDAAGLMVGAAISSLNFLATGAFLRRSRGQASLARPAERAGGEVEEAGAEARTPGLDPEEERRRQIAAGNRAAFRFILRYLLIGVLLVILTLGLGLPAVTTVLGVAAVPFTIYLWQMGRLVTGRWRTPSA